MSLGGTLLDRLWFGLDASANIDNDGQAAIMIRNIRTADSPSVHFDFMLAHFLYVKNGSSDTQIRESGPTYAALSRNKSHSCGSFQKQVFYVR